MTGESGNHRASQDSGQGLGMRIHVFGVGTAYMVHCVLRRARDISYTIRQLARWVWSYPVPDTNITEVRPSVA